MNDVLSKPGKLVAYALVRDKNGKPKFDDIHNIPKPIWDALTPAEQADIEKQRGN